MRRSIVLSCSLTFLLAGSGCANNTIRENGKESYFIFFNSEYMKLNESELYRTYPWILEEYRGRKSSGDGIEEVLVTHSCGLFELNLTGLWHANLGNNLQDSEFESISAYYPGGEFCNISHFISYGPKLLKIKSWNGEYFVLDYWNVRYHGDEKLVIFEFEDVKELGVTEFYKDIDTEKVWDACESYEYITPRDLEWRLKEPFIVKKADEVCFTKAVYLNDLPRL